MELSNAQPLCAGVVVRTDSSSGFAVGSRRGLGRHRHVQTRDLWVHQLTKPLDEKRMMNLLTMMVTSSEEGAQHWRQSQHDDQNCFQHDLSAPVFFWKHAESCSDFLESVELRNDILERDGRAVASYWVGGMQIFVKTLTSKSGI